MIGSGYAILRRPPYSLEILARVQPRLRPRAPRLVGAPQGRHRRGHRRLHPPGVVRGAPRQPGAGRAGAVASARRPRPGGRAHPAALVPRAGALHALGGDLHDLQARRAHPQGPPPGLRAGPGGGGAVQPAAGAHRQHRLGRTAHPRTGLARSAGDHAGERAGLLSGAGARVDAVVRGARVEVRLRRRRRLLPGPGRPHLRAGDGAVLGPGDELAGVVAGPVPAGEQLGRALAADAGPRGVRVLERDGLLLDAAGAGDRRGLRRHGRVLPGGGQVPSRRPPQVRRLHGADRDQAPAGALPGVLHRVEELADRPEGARLEGAAGFRNLIQLPEIVGETLRVGPKSKAVAAQIDALTERLGPDLGILTTAPLDEVARVGSSLLAEALGRLREGRVLREAGYDGEYGVIRLFERGELERPASAAVLFERGELERPASAAVLFEPPPQVAATPKARRAWPAAEDASAVPAPPPAPGPPPETATPRPGGGLAPPLAPGP